MTHQDKLDIIMQYLQATDMPQLKLEARKPIVKPVTEVEIKLLLKDISHLFVYSLYLLFEQFQRKRGRELLKPKMTIAPKN